MRAPVLARVSYRLLVEINAPSWRLAFVSMRSPMLACLLQSAAALTLNGFSCRVTINIGREPGTWMPDDWAASGARMSLPLDVTFSDELVECAEPNFLQNRDVKLPSLSGEGSSTSRLHCSGGSFVGAQGEVVVKADGGAWSAQPTGQCGEHLLRFYLDFPEGTARNDVSSPAGRPYFTTLTLTLTQSLTLTLTLTLTITLTLTLTLTLTR